MKEIEKRFLLKNDEWKKEVVSSSLYRQRYLPLMDQSKGVVRIRQAGNRGFITLKSHFVNGTRDEFEYEIPFEDAGKLMNTMGSGFCVEKIRHIVPCGTLRWEIDVFQGENEGLAIAEIELPSLDTFFPRPGWLGREITGMHGFGNASLAVHPFSQWNAAEKSIFLEKTAEN